MHALKKMTISIRSQAAVIFVLMAFWYWSAWLAAHTGKAFIGDLSLFWAAVFVLLPFIAPLFGAIMVISYLRSGHLHRWWVYPAVFVALSPWLLFLIVWLLVKLSV